MGLYFFHIRDGERLIKDEEGLLLADTRAVECEARLSASEIARQYMQANKSTERLKIEVENRFGAIVASRSARDALH